MNIKRQMTMEEMWHTIKSLGVEHNYTLIEPIATLFQRRFPEEESKLINYIRRQGFYEKWMGYEEEKRRGWFRR